MKSDFPKRKTAILIGVAVLICTVSASVIFARSRAAATPAPVQASRSESLVAGPGRVEPTSEDIKLGSELSGKLKSVYVEEGDAIHRGQVVAELENDDYRAQVASAEADVTAKEATLRKVVNGARSQERLEAWSSVRAAEAVMNNARSEMERRHKLFQAGVVSREETERYAREYDVAAAKYREAAEHTRWSTTTPAKRTRRWPKPI